MTPVTLESCLSDDNLTAAMENFRNKSNSCGIDGVMVCDLPEYWQSNKARILASISDHTFRPGIVKLREITAANGKRRMISQMNSIDRLLTRAISQELVRICDGTFSKFSFAYRENKGTLDAANQAADFMQQGRIWSGEIDIHHYFDNIPHELLLKKLSAFVGDPELTDLISMYLNCAVDDDCNLRVLTLGIIQGSPMSNVLSNIYLNDFDHYLEDQGCSFCRFGDNINIYEDSYQKALAAEKDAEAHLTTIEHLPVNEDKSGTYNGLNRRFLGFVFEKRGRTVCVKRASYNKKGIYYDWHITAVSKIDHNYHLINDGILTRKDYNILFENDKKKTYIPIEVTDSLYVYSNITFSSGFFEMLNKKGLQLTIFDRFGNKVGNYIPENNRRSTKTEMNQIRLISNDAARLEIARRMELADVNNIRSNVRYYFQRSRSEKLKEIADQLSAYMAKMNEAGSVDALMILEAQARQLYYQSFNEILGNSEFSFTKRTRMPPKDPLNAMISFGNTLLYQRFSNEINKTTLDIRFSFIHSSAKRVENLNLDLADLFKPILVDRTIFTLVNRKMLDAKKDFIEVERDGIYIGKRGKRIFIEEFERKLYQKVSIGDSSRTYDALLRMEVQNVKKMVDQKVKYKPYKYSC